MDRGTNPPLYLKLADKIEGMIEASTFRAGDRLPSVRHLSQQQNVSIPTVIQAYLVLEDRRLIESRPKSGFFVLSRVSNGVTAPASSHRVPQARSLAKFPPLMSLVHDVVNPSFVPMGGGHPSAELLPGRKLARTMASLARLHTHATVTCDPAPGCARLREELSRRSLDWGCYLTPDDFIVTNGATEALFLALSAVARPGDTVMVESPTHYGILNILSQLSLKAVAIPSRLQEGLDLKAAAKVAARERVAAIVVMPNFSNPLGSCMSDSDRAGLMALAVKHDIPIIEDDVYGDLYFEGSRPKCLKALDRDHRVMLCSSFSKTLAPGYRVGFLSPGRHGDKIIPAKMALNYCSTPLPAMTVAEFLKNGGYEHHLGTLRRTFRDHVLRMREALSRALPEGVKITDPKGGFVLWVELPASVDAMELFHDARRMNISIAPGHLFSPAAEFKNYIRISCAHPWSRRIEEGVTLLGKLVNRFIERDLGK